MKGVLRLRAFKKRVGFFSADPLLIQKLWTGTPLTMQMTAFQRNPNNKRNKLSSFFCCALVDMMFA